VEWLFQPQGGNAPLKKPNTNVTKIEWNMCQIFRKNVEMTKTLLAASKSISPSNRQYQRKKKGIELLRDFECSMAFGRRQRAVYHTSPSGFPIPLNSMGGIFEYCKKHGKKSVRKLSTMTELPFEKLLRHVFRYGSIARYLACGTFPGFIQKKMPQIVSIPTTQTYGVSVYQYLSPHGTVNIVPNPVLGDCGYLVEMQQLCYRPLKNRDVTLRTNTQNIGDDFIRDSYLAEWTYEIRQPDNLVTIGIPGTSPKGLPEGSIASTETKGWEVEDWEPSLDEILGLEEAF
jgi:hypothetical protein